MKREGKTTKDYRNEYDYPENVLMATENEPLRAKLEDMKARENQADIEAAFEEFLSPAIFRDKEIDVIHGYFRDKLPIKTITQTCSISRSRVMQVIYISLRKMKDHSDTFGNIDKGSGTMPVEHLGFSRARISLLLREGGISTVDQLTVRSEKELLKIRGLGATFCDEIKDRLGALGLELRAD